MRASGIVLLAVGCAAAPGPVIRTADLEALDAWDRPIPQAGPRTLDRPRRMPAARRFPHPTLDYGSGPRVDLAVHEAPLEHALRLLAEAAGVGLVVEGELTQPVTLELRRVRPLEAMHALAWANGLELERSGPVVIARPRR